MCTSDSAQQQILTIPRLVRTPFLVSAHSQIASLGFSRDISSLRRLASLVTVAVQRSSEYEPWVRLSTYHHSDPKIKSFGSTAFMIACGNGHKDVVVSTLISWRIQRKQVILKCLISFPFAFGVNVELLCPCCRNINIDPERNRKRNETIQEDLFSPSVSNTARNLESSAG